jgi:methylthioribose-1-phosphate isomerase
MQSLQTEQGNNMHEMNVYEKFAADQFLSSYPKNTSLAQLFLMLRETDEDVLVWDPFFDAEPEEVVEAIINMIDALQDTFVPKEVV